MARGASDRVTVPAGGGALTIRFDGRAVALWSGEGVSADLLATRGDRVMSWPDVETCERYAREHGWPHASDATDDDSDDDWTLDLEPAQAWLRGTRHTLDPVSALDLWNFQWDVVASRTGSYPVIGRLQGRCHDKLTRFEWQE